MCAPLLATLITYNPLSLREDITLAESAEWFDSSGVRTLPVVDAERHVVGMLPAEAIQMADSTTKMVGDAVHPLAVALQESATVAEVIEALLTSGERTLPIVREGKLIGLISQSDVLREFSYGELECYHRPVRDMMLGDETGFSLNAEPAEVLRSLQQEELPMAVVLQGECPIGVVPVDTLEQSLRAGSGHTLKSIMNPHMPTCHAHTPAGKAAELLVEDEALAVVVVDRGNRHVGTLPAEALLRLMRESLVTAAAAQ